MSECRRHALIHAPIERIWELVGNPARHPEWFPRVIEVRGERFDTGDVFMQVTRGPLGSKTTALQIDALEELHALQFHCTATGMYSNWALTAAQDDTFVEAEFGMNPIGLGNRMFDVAVGRVYFQRWLDAAFRSLADAVGVPR